MSDAALTEIDPTARTLRAGDLEAVFMPGLGMLGASLRHRGEELLGRLEDIKGFALAGHTCGIPLLHPWANRLSGTSYDAAGHHVSLEASTDLYGHDEIGLPIHGVKRSLLVWQVTGETGSTLEAQLDGTRTELLAVYPFPHRLEMRVEVRDDGLTIQTRLIPTASDTVPVSFGFHPYFRIPNLPRAEWQVKLPAMRRLLHDDHMIPNGQTMPFNGFDTTLGDRAFDDGFAVDDPHASFSLAGAGRRITVEFVEGYTHAQVFAPNGKDYIAFEPMTAEANALISGRELVMVKPGESFQATFRIKVEDGNAD